MHVQNLRVLADLADEHLDVLTVGERDAHFHDGGIVLIVPAVDGGNFQLHFGDGSGDRRKRRALLLRKYDDGRFKARRALLRDPLRGL